MCSVDGVFRNNQGYSMTFAKDINILKRNCCRLFTESSHDLAKAMKALETMLPDGSWDDIDYDDQTASGWRSAIHLSNILAMSAAWVHGDTPLYKDAGLWEGICRSLEFWFKEDRRCQNWWYNEILVPCTLGRIGILLESFLSGKACWEALCGRLRQASFGMTGQNRVWRAEAVMLSGILDGDGVRIGEARQAIVEEVGYGDVEGIRRDGCFHQHGSQIQFGNYGLSYLKCISEAMYYFSGTCWAFSEPSMSVLRYYVSGGMNWVLWKGTMDLQGMGRQVRKDSQEEKYSVVMRSLSLLSQCDKGHRREYMQVPRGNRMFYNSDFMVHRTGAYYASCRANSVRTVPVETTINFDNLLGRYFSDGCLLTMRTGREYFNICGCWDWTRLPGTTCPATPRYTAEESKAHGYKVNNVYPFVTHSATGRWRGESTFTGGVSDGRYGCMVYTMEVDGVRGKKSYFFGKDVIVALGCDIESTSPYAVATSVEQSLHCGEVQSGDGWIYHNGIGYYGAGMRYECVRRQGDWLPIWGSYKESILDEKDIFQITIEHGTGVRGGSYCYGIFPNSKVEDMPTAGRRFKVLSNDSRLQAVSFAGGLVMAVFHAPGVVRCGFGDFRALTPGVFIIRKDGFYCADPTQKKRSIRVEAQGNEYRITLPSGGICGSSVYVAL